MKIRSGRTSRARLKHSEPSAAETVSKPCFSRAVFKTCTSVGESSTIMISAIRPTLPRSLDHVAMDRSEQLVLREGLGQILLGADETPASPVEQAVLAGQHDHRRILEKIGRASCRARCESVDGERRS